MSSKPSIQLTMLLWWESTVHWCEHSRPPMDENFEKFRPPLPSVNRELSEPPFNARKYFGSPHPPLTSSSPPRRNKCTFPNLLQSSFRPGRQRLRIVILTQ